MSNTSLKEMARDMATREPNSELEYYSLTLTASENGQLSWSVQGQWKGFVDEERKVELRSARLVNANDIISAYRNSLEQECFVVNSVAELRIYLLLGGNSVVEKEIAEKHLANFLKPHPVVQIGFVGFQSVEGLDKSIFQRAPTKRQRMVVLKRDHYRCKICGRSAHNNVDITLHVHHIRPWAQGGVTHDENLITLCHTCHEGLDPHADVGLFGLMNESGALIDANETRLLHIEAIKRYREKSFCLVSDE